MIIKIVKTYLGLSLVLLWAVWGQFIFGQFFGPAYISQDLQAPSYVVGTNYKVLIYCTCHFQGGSLCFSFCLLVSSVSDFRPDTWGWWWALFQAHLFSRAVGREGHCKQTTLACARSVSATLGLLPAHGTHSLGSRLLHWELSKAGPGLHAPPRSKPLRLRHSGSPQRRRLCWACVLCPSQVREAQVFGKCGHCDLSPLQSLLLSSLGVQPVHLLRRMLTIQNPKKPQLAKKPACSLVDNVSLGLQLPPSGSGCFSLEGDDLQLAISVQSFVL